MKLDDGFPQFVEVFCILMQKKKKKIWGVQSDIKYPRILVKKKHAVICRKHRKKKILKKIQEH